MRVRIATNFTSLIAVTACFWLAPSQVAARRNRPLFEPTDLELEEPGVIEGDFQFGFVRGEGPARLVVPDFEIDFGLLPFLELDIDGAYALEGPSSGPFALDHSAPDSLWLAAKVGFYDGRNPANHTALAIGMQLGPKLPVALAAHGAGAEALLLLGTTYADLQLVWNAGGFIDPAPDSTPTRPRGLEFGVDVSMALGNAQRFAAIGSVSLVHFLSKDADQLLTTAGMSWSVGPALDLSLLGLVGLFAGGDHYGVLVGVAPKLQLLE